MLFDLQEITAGYGPAVVLHQVQAEVSTGEIVCIIGPNGAGKSTVLKAAAGQLPLRGGRVLFDGRDLAGQSTRQRGRNGLIFIPQGSNIFPNLSVHENLEMAGHLLQNARSLQQRIAQVLERFPALRPKQHRPARELSGGERQILALSRTWIVEPKIVLLDEPSLGLAPLVVDFIFDEIHELNAGGKSFLLVEQNARKGLSVSHRGYVLELGRNRLAGTGRDLLQDPAVQRLYLGG